VLVIFTPKEGVIRLIDRKYGSVTYESLGENESLGGIIATRNSIFSVRNNGQTYDFTKGIRLVFDPEKIKITSLSESQPVTKKEKLNRRKRYIEYAKISGLNIKDYSKRLGEWGDNPRTEPRSRKIREIYVLCNNCEIPIWICDTLEPVLNWGESEKAGLDNWLRENYQEYLGLPLYKIPPIDFTKIDINKFPKIEKQIIEEGKLGSCKSFAEQNIVLLQEALKLFNLNPILIDQRKLRKIGAFRKGVDAILSNKKKLEKTYGENNLFRVECPKCGKYVYNVEIEGGKVKGICEGKVRRQRTGELIERYKGCKSLLEENLDYLYTNAIPNGKILTSIYMSNSNVGVFFPDFEFVPENMATGELEKIIRTTGESFNSGIPKIVKTGWFTKDRNVENIFEVLDYIPAEEIIKRFRICPTAERRININKESIEPLLVNKLKNFNPPTSPRLIADVLYSLNGKTVDLDKLGWNINNRAYIIELLRCLGNVRKNKIIKTKPKVNWKENYQKFMDSKYLTEKEISNLRENMKDSKSKVRTIMETAYLATLVN
jgi:hypothetical protein